MARIELFLLAVCFTAIRALYEDQVGSVDWYRQYVGPVSYLSLDGATPQGCKRLLVASESGVVAAIDAATGDIAWRHVYEREGGAIDAVFRNKWGLVTVSRGGQLLRSWDVSSGVLRWESPTGLNSAQSKQLEYPLDVEWRPGAVVASLAGKSLDMVVVAVGTQVAGFSGRSGDKIWSSNLELEADAAVSYIHSTDLTLHLLSAVETQKLHILSVDPASGKVERAVQVPATWLSADTTSCAMAGEVVACLDKERQIFFHTTGERFIVTILDSLGIGGAVSLEASEDGDQFWVHSDHTHWLLGLRDNSITVATKTSHTLSLSAHLDKGSVVSVGVEWGGDGDGDGDGEGRWVQVGMGGDELSRRVALVQPRGRPVQADVFLTRQKSQTISFQLSLLMEDSSILMIHSPGEVVWVREEGLGAVVAVEAIDLPPADQSGSITNFITSTKNEGNPLKLGLMRLQLQLSLAKEFVRDLQSRGLPTLLTSSDDLIRDQFNIRKMIVVATETGKLYGLDSKTGNVVWQDFIPDISPLDDHTLTLHLLRSTSHPPLPPLCVLIGVSTRPSCEGHLLHAFNPITGDHMTLNGDGHMTCLGQVKQMLLLPHLDHTHSHTLLYMTQDMKVHTLPSSPHLTPHTLSEQLFLYSADVESGLLTGYHLERNTDQLLEAQEAWHVAYPTEFERIIAIVTRQQNEHVSSPGRVKSDRSVQYKYLNPHLFAVVTHGDETTTGEKPFFSVYLVDGVTGATIHHTTHRNAAGPVNFVLSENWIVYHYYSTKLRRYELAVTELHEPPSNHTHTLWSSLSPPSLPVVTSQAYTFPSSIATMTTTQTKRGLTHKSIIMGLRSGHIVSLPKRFLDPRRDIVPTDDMKEDGLPLYNPEMMLRPVMFINYNQTVSNMRAIHIAASGLESTCLVLVCGLDLYFTRVTPSKQFDLLAEDFDYPLIAAVVLALIVGTFVVTFLAKRKALKSLWN